MHKHFMNRLIAHADPAPVLRPIGELTNKLARIVGGKLVDELHYT
jgi:hypothetical protein